MSKNSKIFLKLMFMIICIISIILLSNIAIATDINMNLQTSDTTSNTSNTSSQTTNNNTNASLPTSTTTSTTVSTLSDLPEANLGLSVILNIILIVLGFLLVLLGIAIWIRLK